MKKLTINVSPHIFTHQDTRYLMKSVLKALIPAVAAGIYFFRVQAVLVMLACIAGCVLAEYSVQRVREKKVRINDLSAVLSGVLLALVLPPAIPLWMAFLGGLVAIGLGKKIFGGIGCNIFNPALLARAFLMAAFPIALTTWSHPVTLDTITTATPLGLAKFDHTITPYASLFFGNVGGCIGETSALALLLGIGYLFYKKVIDHRIPAAYLGTVAVFSGVLYLVSPGQYASPLFHLLAGGLLIGAGFMATDLVTTPITKQGRWIFGAGCGLVTMTIRVWGGLPEGVMYSILFMNACTPLINRFTRPKRFGIVK